MNKTAKHFKTRETNQNQSLSEEWEWDNHFPNVSVFKPSAHLCTSGRPKRWQWANTRQALPQSLWELLHLNTQRTSIIFNYFLFAMICKYGMIIMPHHRKAAKTKGPFGSLRNFLICTAAWEPFCHFGSTTSWPDRPLWAACTRWRRACRDTQSPAQDSSCTIKTWQPGAKFDIWCYNMELKDRHFWLLVSWVL